MGSSTSKKDLDETVLNANTDTPKGIPFKKPTCWSRVWKKFGLPCSPFDSLQFESRIVVETSLWQEHCAFNGHIEYYGIQQGRHGAICLRRTDGVQTDNAALAELLIRRPNGKEKQWFIQVRCHKWNPNEVGAIPGTHTLSQHKWNAVTALDALAKYSNGFGTYNPLTKNCRHFVEGLRKGMIGNGPSRDVPITPFTLGFFTVPARFGTVRLGFTL